MFKMQRVHVYKADVEDKPGGTASRLKALAEAGAHLEYVSSERSGTPGVGELLVAPRQVKAEMDLVKKAGFHEVQEPIVMRFEGQPGDGRVGDGRDQPARADDGRRVREVRRVRHVRPRGRREQGRRPAVRDGRERMTCGMGRRLTTEAQRHRESKEERLKSSLQLSLPSSLCLCG
jgi:hypothetical protein